MHENIQRCNIKLCKTLKLKRIKTIVIKYLSQRREKTPECGKLKHHNVPKEDTQSHKKSSNI